jgi:hypothetical protein
MEEDEQLIEAVKKQPILHDLRSVAYRNTQNKEAIWCQVAPSLKTFIAMH